MASVFLRRYFFLSLMIFEGIAAQHPENQIPSSKIPNNALSTKRPVVRQKIVLYHNFFRSRVSPPAKDMLKMSTLLTTCSESKQKEKNRQETPSSWHQGAANQAQAYAEECRFLQHNDNSERAVPLLGECGQNIFVSSVKSPWFFAIKSWYSEVKDFKYGSNENNLTEVGHYTQMVWSHSHRVGCGIALCSGGPWGHYYNYVCHYCPGGNKEGYIQYPYKKGSSCQDCPKSCEGKALCSNACPLIDVFSNCEDLVQFPGFCQQGNCNATCNCAGKRLFWKVPKL